MDEFILNLGFAKVDRSIYILDKFIIYDDIFSFRIFKNNKFVIEYDIDQFDILKNKLKKYIKENNRKNKLKNILND